MNSLTLKLEDHKQMRPALTGMLTEFQSGFAAILDKVPEPLKQQFAALKKKTDDALLAMQSHPSDQIPAAQEASWGLRQLAYALSYMQEQQTATMKLMEELSSRFATGQTELQSLRPFKDQVDKGELLNVEQVTERTEKAVEEALKAERQKWKLLGDRRTELQSLNLPLPADEVLQGEDKIFTDLKKEGEKRFKKLTELGVATELQSADMAALIYGPEAEYNRTVALAEKLKSGRGAEGRKPEPLLGGGGGGEGLTKRRAF